MGSKQEEHNRGQEDGSKAGAFDEVVEMWNPFSSSEYKQGFVNGVLNRPETGNEDENDDEY